MIVLDRARAPGVRAFRDAGPPDWQIVLAALGGGAVDVGLAWSAPFEVPWPIYALLPGLACLAVALFDTDGWAIRGAIAYVGLEQRRRWRHLSMPITAATADRWLADPANQAASPQLRVSVMVTAGRYDEALEVLSGIQPTAAAERVGFIRMRALIAAAIDPSVEIDLEAIRLAAADLPAEERRYQVVAAAWSRAWLDLVLKRPWRTRFATVAREHAPYAAPQRVRAWIVIQQLAAPITFLLAIPLFAVVTRLLR